MAVVIGWVAMGFALADRSRAPCATSAAVDGARRQPRRRRRRRARRGRRRHRGRPAADIPRHGVRHRRHRASAGGAGQHRRAPLGSHRDGHRAERQTTVIVNLDRVRSIPLLVAAVLAAFAVLSLSHELVVSARQRRRDIGILKALGANRSFVAGRPRPGHPFHGRDPRRRNPDRCGRRTVGVRHRRERHRRPNRRHPLELSRVRSSHCSSWPT